MGHRDTYPKENLVAHVFSEEQKEEQQQNASQDQADQGESLAHGEDFGDLVITIVLRERRRRR
eukprot:CAMPEP_0175919910 /NCGR_PEP_ID=MMETSP0108-20121206/12643_1 /TAXON_ID=195067 ORGANISM="Goniomonas pacifica, Strain CCMP1869" /NCGR_SAMPLE_ID=MMETSP0108 /ASSEMBLY_ACC=CAM_ASM_000204 /LENGTH=62 /DNA_ID=CAMNT_0017242583 /DNA_START=291 /DNA_END=476 /DNA_ORIENTATION=+